MTTRVSVGDVELFVGERHPSAGRPLIGLHGRHGRDATKLRRLLGALRDVARFREIGGYAAADVVRRDSGAPSGETTAEWRRVCGPLMTRRPPDPEIARLDEARIETTEVPCTSTRS